MKILTLIAFFATLSLVYSQNKAVVCYYQGAWSPVAPDPTICTHMMFAFLSFLADGTISAPNTENFSRFTKLRNSNPNLKLFVSLGGAGGSTNFKYIMGSSTAQTRFTDEVRKVLIDNGLDGIDIDYEPSNDNEKVSPSTYTRFIATIKQALPAGKLLSIAVFPDQLRVDELYEPLNLSNLVDFINLMTYDFHGAWGGEVTYYHSLQRKGSLDTSTYWQSLNVEACANYWVSKSAAKNKLMLGAPLYGKTYTLSNSNNNGVGAAFSGPGWPDVLLYRDICSNVKFSGWTERYQSGQDFFYAFRDNQWVSYDNVDTIGRRADYIKSNNFGGIMFWSIDQDDYSNACGTGNFPIIKKAYNILVQNGNTGSNVTTVAPNPNNPTPAPAPPVTIPSGGFRCLLESGLYPHPTDCTKFISCASFKPYEYNCPATLVFNPLGKYCDYLYNVPSCSGAKPATNAPVTNAPVTNAPVTNAPITAAPVTNAPVTNAPVTNAPATNAPVTNAPATAAPSSNACGTRLGLVANPNDCNTFWNCDGNGVGGLLNCGYGQLGFNPVISACDWKTAIPNCK